MDNVPAWAHEVTGEVSDKSAAPCVALTEPLLSGSEKHSRPDPGPDRAQLDQRCAHPEEGHYCGLQVCVFVGITGTWHRERQQRSESAVKGVKRSAVVGRSGPSKDEQRLEEDDGIVTVLLLILLINYLNTVSPSQV